MLWLSRCRLSLLSTRNTCAALTELVEEPLKFVLLIYINCPSSRIQQINLPTKKPLIW